MADFRVNFARARSYSQKAFVSFSGDMHGTNWYLKSHKIT